MRHCDGNPIFLRLRAVSKSVACELQTYFRSSLVFLRKFRRKRSNDRKYVCSSQATKSVGVIRKSRFCLTRTALCTLYYSIVYLLFSIVLGSTYPTHLRRLVLLQKRIVRIISKKGFDANTNPLFNSLMILKLEHIYSLHLRSSPLASLSCENIMV